MSAPLILTLKLDAASSGFFDDLRVRHFPPDRNFLRAHVTLFHHLPGADLGNIKRDLTKICIENAPFSLAFTRWRFLGKGTAMTIKSEDLLNLRARLVRLWNENLTAQDRQKFQPHITVQNKVAPAEARELFEKLSADWQVRRGEARGLSLWHYLGSNWRLEKDFLFSD